jgi:hypothetical protein
MVHDLLLAAFLGARGGDGRRALLRDVGMDLRDVAVGDLPAHHPAGDASADDHGDQCADADGRGIQGER